MAIPCFITQDSPADRRELIIQDDAGELKYDTGEGWQIISISRRFRSLPEKFNALAGLAQGDILVVWEDATGRFHARLAFRREAFDRISAGP